MNNYDIFQGEELKIADKIKRLRLCMLVHSCIYYNMDDNIISDSQWSKLGTELASIQQEYPQIASKVDYADAFKDWDGSTGAFLPLDDEWVVKKAKHLLQQKNKLKVKYNIVLPVKNTAKTALFNTALTNKVSTSSNVPVSKKDNGAVSKPVKRGLF